MKKFNYKKIDAFVTANSDELHQINPHIKKSYYVRTGLQQTVTYCWYSFHTS